MSSDPSHGVQPATIGLPQTQTINSSAPSASGRLQIMDGYVMRDVWVPSDGDGEAHDGLGNNFKAAQPNWKIYTGDAPAPDANRHSEMPPKFCYLDDKAVWNVFSCKLFSKANKGLYWPFDFIHNGNLRLSRKNRGRPALDENQQEREVDSGKAAKISYRLSGSPFAVDAEFLRIERDKETRGKTYFRAIILSWIWPAKNSIISKSCGYADLRVHFKQSCEYGAASFLWARCQSI